MFTSKIPFVIATIAISTRAEAFMMYHAQRRDHSSTWYHQNPSSSARSTVEKNSPFALQVSPRYGPKDAEIIRPSSGDGASSQSDFAMIKSDFTSLLDAVVSCEQPEELPSLMTKNIDLILAVMGRHGLLEEIIQDDIQRHNKNEERLDEVSEALSVIISFTETFVEQAKSMDDVYKELMGKIFRTISPGETGGSLNSDAGDLDEELDELLANEKEAFSPGFLRHLEGECSRIASLPKISPDSSKMLQILRLIQTRVLEELGKGIGEGAIVLGQLLGYDDKAERLAVLDAGLAVRGIDFAYELAALTEEALEGFKSVSGGADPGLVNTIQEIDDRIRSFIEKSDFQ
mmetsp:Transcript_6115/g.13315  ORF Transcript_6115/g.13315 Transcript_6115/m.13315 type:complete len:346 (+) Transcript_6115:85-1122(+)